MGEIHQTTAINDETLALLPGRDPLGRGHGEVEKALRDSAELRARLEDVRQNRGDAGAPHPGGHLAPRPPDLPDPPAAR